MMELRSLRLPILAVVTGLVLGLAGCGSPRQAAMSDSARAYLTRALAVMRTNSLESAEVDWSSVTERAFASARFAQTDRDTYPAIKGAVLSLGDMHSGFVPAGSSPTAGAQSPQGSQAFPSGYISSGRFAVVDIPAVGSDSAVVARYVRTAATLEQELDRSAPCGWIVDLRGDSGGDLWPMLAALTPLLNGPTLGSFVYADGHRAAWTLHGDRFYVDNDTAPIAQTNDVHLSHPHPPVAVLVGERTASSGEASLVAFRGQSATRTFGAATAGVPSANEAFALSDGATLRLTVAQDADRTGTVYPNLVPISPDQVVSSSSAIRSPGQDPVVAAAGSWLGGQGACAS